MPDQRDENDEETLGIDWLTSQLSDDDEDQTDVDPAGSAQEDVDADRDGTATSAAGNEPAPTVAMPVVSQAAPSASSRELRFSSTPPGEDGADSPAPPAAETFPSRAERVEAERAEADRIEAERVDAERVVAIRAAADRAAAEHAAAEKAAAERAELERIEAERVEAERAETERVEAERAEVERLEAERAEAVRAEAERVEAQRVAAHRAERAETERAQAERAQRVRVDAERAEAARVIAERADAERATTLAASASAGNAAPASAAHQRPDEIKIEAEAEAEPEPEAKPDTDTSAEAVDDNPVDEATPEDTDPGIFLWGLTPTTEPDPAVEARRKPEKSARPAATAAAAPAAGASAVNQSPVATPEAATPALPDSNRPPAATAAPVEPTEPLTKPPFSARRTQTDPEAAPWWTTPAAARLERTKADQAALGSTGTAARAAEPGPTEPVTTGPVATAPVSAASAALAAAGTAAAGTGTQVTGAEAAGSAPAGTTPTAGAPAPVSGAAGPAERRGGVVSIDPTGPAAGSGTGPTTGTKTGSPTGSNAGASPRTPRTRTLAWIGGAVLAVLVIIGLFFLAQNLAGAPVAAPTGTQSEVAIDTAAPAPTPTAAPAPTAPQPAGVHAWNVMFGSECLEPYTSPWDEEFTVVDCAAPHTAQLVHRGILEGESGSPFPGEQAFAEQINVLCSAPGVIDFTAAGAYDDLQLQGSYPVTAEQWDAGDRYFYCFASRSSGEPLTGTLAPVA